MVLIGNDIEIDGQKVSRVLDISASLRQQLADFLERANNHEIEKTSFDKLQGQLLQAEQDAQSAYSDGKADGYAEGREDGQG
jgi:flagellar biosynthesis/type III secretory pathway protein FliH